jgi:hypothetical protein
MGHHRHPRGGGQSPQPSEPPAGIAGHIVGQVDDSGVSRPGDLDDGLGPVPAPNDQRPAASAQACVEVSQRLQQEAKTALMPAKRLASRSSSKTNNGTIADEPVTAAHSAGLSATRRSRVNTITEITAFPPPPEPVTPLQG